MNKNTKIFLFIVIIFFTGICSYFLVRQKNKSVETINFDLPLGVELNDQETLIIENDYSFKIEKDKITKIENKNDILAVYEKNFLPVYTFSILNNLKNLTLIDWLEKYNQEYLLIYFDKKENKIINGKQIYKIKMEGDPEYYNYYIDGENSKVYIFSTISDSEFENILENFNIIEK